MTRTLKAFKKALQAWRRHTLHSFTNEQRFVSDRARRRRLMLELIVHATLLHEHTEDQEKEETYPTRVLRALSRMRAEFVDVLFGEKALARE